MHEVSASSGRQIDETDASLWSTLTRLIIGTLD